MQNTMAQDCIAFSTNAAAEPRLFGQVLDGVNGQNLDDEFWIHGSEREDRQGDKSRTLVYCDPDKRVGRTWSKSL